MDEATAVETTATSSIVVDSQSSQNDQVSRILRPNYSIRNIYSPRTVLVVASEKCLNVPDDLKTFTEGENPVNVHYTKKLPLSSKNYPSIDVVILVYKVFDSDSLKTIKESLLYIDVRYFVGKCFILVTSESQVCRIDTEEVEAFAQMYNLPIHYILKKRDANGVERLQIPSNLMTLYCPASGRDCNSLLANSTIVRSARWC